MMDFMSKAYQNRCRTAKKASTSSQQRTKQSFAGFEERIQRPSDIARQL